MRSASHGRKDCRDREASSARGPSPTRGGLLCTASFYAQAWWARLQATLR